MNDKDKNFIEVYDCKFYPEKFLFNPIGVCSYQAYDRLLKLQAENAKLRECVEFYANFMNYSNLPEYGDGVFRTALFSDMEEINDFTKYGGKRARQCLKELEEK